MTNPVPAQNAAAGPLRALFDRSSVGYFLSRAEPWLRRHTGDNDLTVTPRYFETSIFLRVIVIVASSGITRRVVFEANSDGMTLAHGARPRLVYRVRRSTQDDRFFDSLRCEMRFAAERF